MNWKWYIPVLIIALAFFGISLEQSTLPNQEIVVQFNTKNVSAAEAEQAIANVTSQLKSIGIAHVLVSEIQNGQLKVSYYSSKDVATIKGLFSGQNKLQLAGTDFNERNTSSKIPFSQDSHIYKLDVVTIQKDFGSNLDLQGILVIVKAAKDQYLKPVFSLHASENNFDLKQAIALVAYKNYGNISLLINHASYKIPEVRAGPFT
ncbi:hypothetical protein K8089_05785 [Aequorivita sp. F47161]|uniref:Uncharacterized protein n=1 Tax=Aequorivita vitellina TaxID=2874475 RepID=A0A9X1QW80_9FLAO|nr:hypothetical protein [Aequorivita vitellina]MCG2418527.1 hypothetical protein [Aequorivita vitellina]